MSKHIAIILLTIILIFVIVLHTHGREGFTTQQEKVKSLLDWFKKNPTPTYTKYKHDIGDKSDIVEYENLMSLYQDKKLTMSSALKVV